MVSAWAHAAPTRMTAMKVRKLGDALDLACGGIAEELQRREARVEAPLAQELGVRALRDQRAALHDLDAVRVLHSGEAVRDGERGAPLLRRVERALHQELARGVERARRLVQQQDRA